MRRFLRLGTTCLLALAVVPATVAIAASTPQPAAVRSVVRVVNYKQRGDWRAPWGTDQVRQTEGSGFLIDGGRILTNAHVVSDARHLVLLVHGDPEPHPAKV